MIHPRPERAHARLDGAHTRPEVPIPSLTGPLQGLRDRPLKTKWAKSD